MADAEEKAKAEKLAAARKRVSIRPSPFEQECSLWNDQAVADGR